MLRLSWLKQLLSVSLVVCSVCLRVLPSSPMVDAKEKVIFDTDTAYFNDDGAALVMLLRHREKIDLLGVTVVPGNEWPLQGAEYMLHVLETMSAADVPLFLGVRAPLVHNEERAKYMAEKWPPVKWLGAFRNPRPLARSDLRPPFGGEFPKTRPRSECGVEFIVETVRQHPGEVTILALGPLTNIALAIRVAPDIETKIKRLVFMGGNVHVPGNITPHAEFNFWFDPEAAHAVLSAPIAEKVMFGLDVTNQAVIGKCQFDELTRDKTPITELLHDDFGRRYPGFLKNSEATAYIWDCLAAGFLIDPDFVTQHDTLPLEVVTEFGPRYGAVRTAEDGAIFGKPVRVMRKISFERFYSMYSRLITAPVP